MESDGYKSVFGFSAQMNKRKAPLPNSKADSHSKPISVGSESSSSSSDSSSGGNCQQEASNLIPTVDLTDTQVDSRSDSSSDGERNGKRSAQKNKANKKDESR